MTSTGVQTIKEVFWGLAQVSPPLLGLGVALNAMGKIGVSTFAKGLADFGIIVGGVSGVVTILGALVSIPYVSGFISSGVKTIKEVFKGLWEVAIPLGGMSVALIGLGLASPVTILSGLAGFALVVDGTALVIASLGALSQIPGFTWLVGEGGKLLCQVGEIIGEFAGSIVKGFIDKTFEGLDTIGTHLSNFMTNAQPFFDGIKDVNAESVASVRSLADTLLILTAQNILEGLTSWFTGGTSLTKFGEDIATFAPYYKQYADIIKDVDGRVVKDSTNSAKALAELASNLPNQGGIVSWFVGDNTLDKFGKPLPEFGKNLKQYSDNVKGIDNSVVESSANSARTLAELAKNLPNQGGLLAWLVGDNTLDKFGKPLPDFGKNLKSYADNVSGLDSSVVENSANSAKALSELARNLPNQGGIVSWFTGDNKISDFGKDLAKFGKAFKEYYEHISNISTGQVNSISSAIGSLVNQLMTIKNNGLGNEARSFGDSIKDMSKKIKDGLKNDISVNYWDYYNIGRNIGQGLIDGMNSQSWNVSNVASNLRNGITGNIWVDYWNMWNIGNNVGQGLIDGMNNKYWSVSYTARDIAQNIVTQFKDELQIHSPSRVMKDKIGKFIPLGIAEGIDKEASSVYKSMTNLVKDITVNPNDFKIDTNQFIDYGQVSGAIATQSNIEVNSSLPQQVKEAVIEGLRNSKIKSEVEIKADKEGIFKIVQTEASEYYIQTGEPAFNF